MTSFFYTHWSACFGESRKKQSSKSHHLSFLFSQCRWSDKSLSTSADQTCMKVHLTIWIKDSTQVAKPQTWWYVSKTHQHLDFFTPCIVPQIINPTSNQLAGTLKVLLSSRTNLHHGVVFLQSFNLKINFLVVYLKPDIESQGEAVLLVTVSSVTQTPQKWLNLCSLRVMNKLRSDSIHFVNISGGGNFAVLFIQM